MTLLFTILLLLLLVMTLAGYVGFIIDFSAMEGRRLAFATKVGLDNLLPHGLLGCDVQQLLCHSRVLMPERMDGHLACGATSEVIDDIGISDIG
jgi:hypothetical protein